MPDSAGRNSGFDRGPLKRMPVLWDITEKPFDNTDREDKLGQGDATRAVAYHDFDAATKKCTLADGFTPENSTIMSARQFEPDNWMLRLHDEKGKGKDSVWALRMIAEHTNKSYERKHRSTMFISEGELQIWGWAQDLFWLVDLAAVTEHPELEINPAGFLNMLYSDDHAGASSKRGCLSLNLSRNGGHVTGYRGGQQRVGQLWHPFTIFSERTASGFGEDGQLLIGSELCLRRDVKFDYNDGGPRMMPDAPFTSISPSVGEVPYKVFFYVDSPGPNLPALDMAKDESSNQTEIEKVTGFPIKAFVLIPEVEDEFDDTVSDSGLSYPKEQYDDEDVGTSGFSQAEPTHSGSTADNSEPMQMANFIPIFPP